MVTRIGRAESSAVKIHHLGIAVNSITSSAALYERMLGIALDGDIVEDTIQKVRVAFAPIGNGVYVEFVEPAGDDSPVRGILNRGGGLYHVCYQVPDIDAAIDRVRSGGGRLVSGPVPARAFNGRLIAWVYTPDRSLVEFLAE
jgi:methylmalonyl-CoA/ethylmalonyl-CoA epimerase